jgi:hypothetical protein
VEKLQGDAEFMEGELNSLRGTIMQQGQQVRRGLCCGRVGGEGSSRHSEVC